jgi:hypothetical protein
MAKISATKNALKKFSGFSALGVGMNAAFAYTDYKDAREQGSSRIGAAARAVGSMALFEAMGPIASTAFMVAPLIPSLAVKGYETVGQLTRQMNHQGKQVPFVNSNFNDFQQAYTMRQAGMQLAQNSQYNLQQTLMGNEAQHLR